MKRSFFISLFLLFASAFCMSAQSQVEQNHDYEGFESVDVSEHFIVRLIGSDKYAVRIKADERLAEHVQSYVKDDVLYVTLDKKSFSSELKKELKGKALLTAALEAEIYAPTINSIVLNGKTSLVQSDTIRIEDFSLVMNDNARVEKLNLRCLTADIAMGRNSYANIGAHISETLTLNTSNSAEAILNQTGGKALVIDAAGSSQVRATVNVPELEIAVASNADLICIGRTDELNLKAAGSSVVEAETLDVNKASVNQSGSSKCYMNVADKITVELTGGSMMTFTGKPELDIVRVVNSTLIKADDPKRK